jgi:hypothetical protein
MSDENFRPFSATLAAIVVVILGSVSPEINITMDARCMVVVHGSCGNGQMIDSSQGEKDLMHGAATPSVPKKDSVDSSARPVPSQAVDRPRKGKKTRKPNRRQPPVFTDRNNCRYS